MKKTVLALTVILAFTALKAQVATGTDQRSDYHSLFSPLFYTYNGNEYRAANGAPGKCLLAKQG